MTVRMVALCVSLWAVASHAAVTGEREIRWELTTFQACWRNPMIVQRALCWNGLLNPGMSMSIRTRMLLMFARIATWEAATDCPVDNLYLQPLPSDTRVRCARARNTEGQDGEIAVYFRRVEGVYYVDYIHAVRR